MVDQSRARRLRYFIGLASLSKSPCSFDVQGHWKTRFSITPNGFIGIRQQNGNKTFALANSTLCHFLLAANTVQVFSAFQTLVCLVHPNPLYRCSAFPFGIAFKAPFLKALSFSAVFHPHAGSKTAILCSRQPTFRLSIWLAGNLFCPCKTAFFTAALLFQGANKNRMGKSYEKFLLYPTVPIPDPSAFPCERTAILFTFWYVRLGLFRYIYRPLFQWGFTTSWFFSRRPAGSETFATIRVAFI